MNELPPLPEQFSEIYPHQEQAVDEIEAAFEDHEVVFLDAPTGTGKTLVAELSRRRVVPQGKAMYVCSGKELQRQFARDFNYAKVLMGRENYPTVNDPTMTAADCTATGGGACWFCPQVHQCPYQIAKDEALAAPLAVTNTAYLLTEANYVGGFSGRDLIIADEGDTLESMLMNFVEFRAPERYLRMIGMSAPKKGARKTTIIGWLGEYIDALKPFEAREMDPKRRRAIRAAIGAAKRVTPELMRDVQRQGEGEDEGRWLREYEERGDALILKPVTVANAGSKYLWRHARKFLIMSATIISADEMADSLGLPLDRATVVVPMTFPVENRPIIMAPVANVTHKEMDVAVPKLIHAIERILERHDGERVIVHTVSYQLTRKLMDGVNAGGRRKFSYATAKEAERALDGYKRTENAVLFAPSMERGVDLPGDLCRVQVIAKVPFPSLGNRQVSARTHLPGGGLWYAVQAVRDIVQMAGRGVRSEKDWATTYILDAQMARNLWGKWKHLFPGWFREAVDTSQDTRWLRQ